MSVFVEVKNDCSDCASETLVKPVERFPVC